VGGPQGWLSGFPAGALLAVRIGADGTARLTALDQQPAASGELVDLLRAVYDAAVVLDELLGMDDDPGMLTHTAALAERLLAVASTPRELAVTHWLTAVSQWAPRRRARR
jgi:hypothetical protein